MDTLTWVVVVCACVTAFAAVALLVATILVVRHQGKVLERSCALTAQHIDFSKRLMSRFCASNNIQAEAFVRQQEQREETANERNRLEAAGTIQETKWLR
jgi:hypothetical protein